MIITNDFDKDPVFFHEQGGLKMIKTTSAGVFQLPNGMWGFRYAFMLGGKQKDIRRNKDKNGNPFKTERAAATTKKSIDCKAIIKKHSKDFGGSLEDPDVIKLCGCSRNSYYK